MLRSLSTSTLDAEGFHFASAMCVITAKFYLLKRNTEENLGGVHRLREPRSRQRSPQCLQCNRVMRDIDVERGMPLLI
jgi:hypothetical protein